MILHEPNGPGSPRCLVGEIILGSLRSRAIWLLIRGLALLPLVISPSPDLVLHPMAYRCGFILLLLSFVLSIIAGFPYIQIFTAPLLSYFPLMSKPPSFASNLSIDSPPRVSLSSGNSYMWSLLRSSQISLSLSVIACHASVEMHLDVASQRPLTALSNADATLGLSSILAESSPEAVTRHEVDRAPRTLSQASWEQLALVPSGPAVHAAWVSAVPALVNVPSRRLET
jgi:hypothetical protein